MRYLRFGTFVLDTQRRTLFRGTTALAVEPKVLACIAFLASRPGDLITHAELHAALWPDVRVGPDALRRVIRQARKTLTDPEQPADWIKKPGPARLCVRERRGT